MKFKYTRGHKQASSETAQSPVDARGAAESADSSGGPAITFYSGVGTVTGANFLFEAAGKRILVDCGLLQGSDYCAAENREPFGYDPSSIDILFVTHAHMDHIGRIPKLVREGFVGEIYSTPETRALSEVMYPDALHLLTAEAMRLSLPPIYEEGDIAHALSLWKTLSYHTPFEIAPGLSVTLYDAGHILGSSLIQFAFKEGDAIRRVLFCGDLGNSPTPLLRDTEVPPEPSDIIISDSVYGDRNHEPLDERRSRLKKVVKDALSKQGTLVIPSFSIERTQVILYELNNLVESKQIPSVPVFVDSPLATRVTDVYRDSVKFFNEKTQQQISHGDDIFNFPKLAFTMTSRDSEAIRRAPNPKIVIAGSGMSSGGRVISHEREYLPDAKSTILFVGYQTAGSLGRRIMEGARYVNIDGKQIPVRAHVEQITGYSAHKDSDHVVEFIAQAGRPGSHVFVVMGEPRAATFLSQRLNDSLEVKAEIPEKGKRYLLESKK